MGLHHHHEADMVCYCLTITLDDMRQIHKGIRHLTCLVDHPRLARLTQKALHPFAHDRTTDIEHEVGHIVLTILYQRHSLIEIRIHGLSCNQHGALSLEEHASNMTQRRRRDVSRQPLYLPFYRQLCHTKAEKRLRNGDIDMNRGIAHDKRLVDKTITIPALLVVTRLWQRDGPLDESSQGIGLWQRLTIELVNPL